MLGIETVIRRLPHHVPRKHMIVFIEGKRLAVNDRKRQDSLNDKQGKYRRPERFAESWKHESSPP